MAERTKVYLQQRDQTQKRSTELTSQGVSALSALAGVLLCLGELMYSDGALAAALVVGCGVILAFLGVSGSPRWTKRLTIGLYVGTLLALAVCIVPVVQGLLDTVNRFITLWNVRFGTEAATFAVSSNGPVSSAVFWALLAVPVSGGILSLVRQRRSATLSLVLLVCLLVGFVLGQSSMGAGMFFGITGVLSNQIASQAPNRPVQRRGLALIIFVLLLTGGIGWTLRGYGGSRAMTNWKHRVTDRVEEIRYGADTLPQGDLTKAPGLLEGNEATLKVTMEQAQGLYLRGFVGGTYTGSAWEGLASEAYLGEYDGLLDWLEQEQLSPVSQYATYDTLSEDEVRQSVLVQNLGADRRYVYLPYSAEGATLEASAQPERDWQMQSQGFFGVRQYTYEDVLGAPTADEIVVAAWLQNPENEAQQRYVQAESVYRGFVEENYMAVPDEVRQLVEQVFFDEDWDGQTDFNAITARIRRVLRDNTYYTAKPEAVPDGEDFITWFLTESKSGNAVYYATTAVMAYRAAGYPARYVEGYRISDKIASAMELIGENTITLTNQNAHAWVEVYVSGVGWMPVEVVPGMYVESYTTQLVEGQPIYKVNAASVAEEGLELTDSNGGGDGVQPDAEPEENGSLMIPARILALLYGLFFLYLLLELQRWLRIRIRRRKTRKLDEEGRVALYARQLMKTLRYGGVEGNYNHPLELTDQVVAQFPGVRAWAYERAVGLVQKVRFGCKPLQPHERHALTGTLATMRQALYSSASFLKRLRLRYQYAVEKTCI